MKRSDDDHSTGDVMVRCACHHDASRRLSPFFLSSLAVSTFAHRCCSSKRVVLIIEMYGFAGQAFRRWADSSHCFRSKRCKRPSLPDRSTLSASFILLQDPKAFFFDRLCPGVTTDLVIVSWASRSKIKHPKQRKHPGPSNKSQQAAAGKTDLNKYRVTIMAAKIAIVDRSLRQYKAHETLIDEVVRRFVDREVGKELNATDLKLLQSICTHHLRLISLLQTEDAGSAERLPDIHGNYGLPEEEAVYISFTGVEVYWS